MESSLGILTLRGPPDICPRPAWPLAPGRPPSGSVHWPSRALHIPCLLPHTLLRGELHLLPAGTSTQDMEVGGRRSEEGIICSQFWHKVDDSGLPMWLGPCVAPAWLAPHGQPQGKVSAGAGRAVRTQGPQRLRTCPRPQLAVQSWGWTCVGSLLLTSLHLALRMACLMQVWARPSKPCPGCRGAREQGIGWAWAASLVDKMCFFE